MSDPQRMAAPARRQSRGQSHILLDRPADPSFDFEDRHLGGLLGASVVSHLAMIVVAILVLRFMPRPQLTEILPDQLPEEIVWLAEEGPGGGGGGGGDNSPEPARKVELPGKEKISVPVEVEPEPVEDAAQGRAAAGDADSGRADRGGADRSPRAPSPPRPSSRRRAPAAAPAEAAAPARAADPGRATAAASGRATPPASAAGEYDIGNGVSPPRVLKEVKPAYTAEAMRAKVQGVVWLRCVVMSDGIGRSRRGRALARLDLRARPGSGQGGAPMALLARHAPRRAGGRSHHHRTHLHAALIGEGRWCAHSFRL